MDFHTYPSDVQSCQIKLESFGHTQDQMQFQWADKNYRTLLRMSGAGGKEKDKVEKVGSDFHRKILGGSDTNENISLAQFSVLVLFHSVRGFPNYVLCTDSLLFSRVFSLPGRNERWICDELLFRHLSWTDCQAGVPTQAPLSFTTDLLPKHNLPDDFLAGPVSAHYLFSREIGYGDDHHANSDCHVRY